MTNPPWKSFLLKQMPAAMAAALATGIVLGLKALTVLEPLELRAYDQWSRWRPTSEEAKRILVVEITEADIQEQKQWPLPDGVLIRALEALRPHEPMVIGIDLFRDFSIPDIYGAAPEANELSLAQYMMTYPDSIIVCKVGQSSQEDIAPPSGLLNDQVGFADLPLDPDGVVRRALVIRTPNPNAPCGTPQSFAFAAAQRALNLPAEFDANEQLRISRTNFPRVQPNSGGYQGIDARGYQILITYRPLETIATTVTLTDLLAGKVLPSTIRDRVVLIGNTATSSNDKFLTPLSDSRQENDLVPGVVIHATIASEILGAVIGNRPLIGFWGEGAILLWIYGWSLAGAVIVLNFRHLGAIAGLLPLTLVGLGAVTFGLFLQSAWVPVVSPGLGVIGGATLILAYRAFDRKNDDNVPQPLPQGTSTQPVVGGENSDASFSLVQKNTGSPTLFGHQTYQTPSPIDTDSPESSLVNGTDTDSTKPIAFTPTAPETFLGNRDREEPIRPARFRLESLDTVLKIDPETEAKTAADPGQGGESWQYEQTVLPNLEPTPEPPTTDVYHSTHSTDIGHATDIVDINEQRYRNAPASDQILGGRYKVLSQLGEGGFGRTYLAEDQHFPHHPICVVKQLVPSRSDPRFLELARNLFRREAETLAKVGQHPLIPQLLAYFEENQAFFLVQEYICGKSLKEEFEQHGTLSEVQVIRLLKNILEVLVYVHGLNVIHRDIKPANIIRRQSDQEFVLIDFGAVRHIKPEDLVRKDKFTIGIGTRGYAPNEQMAGRPSLASDIYSLGVVAIEALSGLEPSKLSHSNKTGDIMWQTSQSLQPKLVEILNTMVHYNATKRYQSAQAVLDDLLALDGQ
ncbi:CHASE2 domain-containing serine/threonine-protein kinase [Candidatus Synechococcus calcipolaris G9]|uniref:non-specific serine/threonine protein kinase n=1 Tax=Candidatus Synechococcus calcipolaris G9 TaxID=1497997 RepID=A0ABT6EZU0_9SYNE|nr:CHASE2 domain-containing serine/threonine-protein kinase [Candidatus Synechococcus calcipolaris]MDG2991129.1 CHASE2 domain-containing serine/threonine-protein kinase [Candidatus Synechococcus calcipolaris G9]